MILVEAEMQKQRTRDLMLVQELYGRTEKAADMNQIRGRWCRSTWVLASWQHFLSSVSVGAGEAILTGFQMA